MTGTFQRLFPVLFVFAALGCRDQLPPIKVSIPAEWDQSTCVLEIPIPTGSQNLDWDGIHIERDSGREIPSQTLDLDGDGQVEGLLIYDEFLPGTTIHYRFSPGKPVEVENDLEARFVPERKDDFAWENDRIAYRMYGPALEAAGEISSGIDVWVKNVQIPILENWYAAGDYHENHGMGGDFYKVGPSRGCGGLAVRGGDSLFVSGNFTSWRILARGPLRLVFELDYDPWGPSANQGLETKRISLDRGSSLNHIVSTFTAAFCASDPILVTGLAVHDPAATIRELKVGDETALTVWEPLPGGNGALVTAVLGGQPGYQMIEEQATLRLEASDSCTIDYWSGAAWSQAGDPLDQDRLERELSLQAQRRAHPARVEILR